MLKRTQSNQPLTYGPDIMKHVEALGFERQSVIEWLRKGLGWQLRTIRKPGKRAVYVFHEPDTGGEFIVHNIHHASLQWSKLMAFVAKNDDEFRRIITPLYTERAADLAEQYMSAGERAYRDMKKRSVHNGSD